MANEPPNRTSDSVLTSVETGSYPDLIRHVRLTRSDTATLVFPGDVFYGKDDLADALTSVLKGEHFRFYAEAVRSGTPSFLQTGSTYRVKNMIPRGVNPDQYLNQLRNGHVNLVDRFKGDNDDDPFAQALAYYFRTVPADERPFINSVTSAATVFPRSQALGGVDLASNPRALAHTLYDTERRLAEGYLAAYGARAQSYFVIQEDQPEQEAVTKIKVNFDRANHLTEIVFPSPFREAVDPLVVDVVHQWILFLIEYGTVYAGIENLEEIITRQTERNPILTAEGFDLQALDDLTTIFLMDASDLERERTLHPTELDCLIALRELVEPETPACQGRLAMAGIRGAKALRATTRASLKL
ncbi:MAG: hypothetical protein A3G32_06665 [Deltaproteobacteria bacterium RIFCSPLOWO2_12_FULL_40_28]|nr:MAG: hypothetical protein A3C45_02760 [Deltaproteobacteria bacterium RIFCSPHIGHO2_02_FULL_40_28]OGQ19129.1 MAG: hypothetical protein A3E27_05850 [Deltaproteobacteria bacterium RIFCSPHIGHO2_12_FULL_40_32]OGQ40301.1 MAG: hypothetical protein A3I69_01290 [Deltaproteobacteria bacterium RIFCSPLOWO2_02_FULL_40_36]OGQ53572.1 MAG: hypothetical protein A3G32_06665 [Deltaproteobacteria bacterium RIFCSPLOWO2_12_FULL_40_28]